MLVVPLGIAFKIAGFLPLLDQLGAIPVSGVCFCARLRTARLLRRVADPIRPIGAGRCWRAQLGGRAPSDREREIFDDVLDGLRESDPGIRVPKSWFVIDDVRNTNGAVLGDTLMLSTGTLMDVSLEAVVAHELGHLTAIDARLTVALNRLALPANLFVRLDEALGEGLPNHPDRPRRLDRLRRARAQPAPPILGRVVPRPRVQSRPVRSPPRVGELDLDDRDGECRRNRVGMIEEERHGYQDTEFSRAV